MVCCDRLITSQTWEIEHWDIVWDPYHLLFCKFLNNCETNCRHTAANEKNKKTEVAVNLVVKK